MTELLEPQCETRIGLVYNPVSGQEEPAARRARLEALLREAGIACNLEETDRVEGATAAARRAVETRLDRLIVCGGDGTVAEAAGVLAGSPVALAVIPAGTGNLLAINLGIPLEPHQAMHLAVTGEPVPTDVGRANGRAFLIMAGMGADARMIRDADRRAKRRWGFLAYFVAAGRHLARARTRFHLQVDDGSFRRRALTVLVANLGRITAGIELIPGADPQSGELRVAVVRTRNAWEFLRLAFRALLRRAGSDERLELLHGRRIVIETAHPQPVQVDGNEAGITRHLEVTVDPGALRLVRPVPQAPSG